MLSRLRQIRIQMVLNYGSKFVIFFATFVTLAVLWELAYHPAWEYHISVDVGVFAQRAYAFAQTGSWGEIGDNEYQPGALYFFLIPLAFNFLGFGYSQIFIFLNLCLLFAHILLLWRFGGAISAWLGLLFMLAAGPILLYRFEALVSLLVLGSFLFYRKKVLFASGLALGLATAVKIYPLLFVPLLFKTGRKFFSVFILVTLGFLSGLGILLGSFFLQGGTREALLASFAVHSLKPVGLQSVAGAGMIIWSLVSGGNLEPVNAYGIHGLGGQGIKDVFNLVLVALFAWFWGMIFFFAKTLTEKGLLLANLLTLLLLLVFSTNIQPQYLFWPAGIIALLPAIGLPERRVLVICGLYSLMLILEQLVYPLGYTDFLTFFYSGASQPALLSFALASKLLLVAITCLVGKEYGLSLFARKYS